MTQQPDHRIAVIGLGYVGLPLALDLVDAGFDVHAVDTSDDRIASLAAGTSYIDDVADNRLASAIGSGRFEATNLDQDWTEASLAFICVPTPVTRSREPDLGPVLAAGAYVRRGLRRDDVVILQSTTYPGTTMGPLRRVLEQDGLGAGDDFGLAFSPERMAEASRSSARSSM